MRTLSHAHAADGGSHGIDLAPMLDFVVNLLGGVHDITFMTTQLATPSNAKEETR